jgi:hypothetical protein
MEPRRSLMMMTLVAGGLVLAGRAGIAAFDICGCVNSPKSLGVFDTVARTGFPPGTVDNFRDIRIPVPADGTLILNGANFLVRPEEGCCLSVTFVGNQANTPLTILVSGDVNIGNSVTLFLNGANGGNGSPGGAGTGSLGGPGGFRGGDAASQLTNGASDGGSGLGPSGGAPGLASGATRAGDGTFFGLAALLPLAGGSGGGGGASFAAQSNCAGGGGGGGGGAILIAANGTITLNGGIVADGGNVGFESNGGCATRGGAGAGGAMRLVANAIVGTGGAFARGGLVDCCTRTGGPGVIRLEAVTNTLPPQNTDPPAFRAAAPGPLANPFSPTVAITTVAGQATPTPATGNLGGIDVFVPVPGPTEIDLATSGVPSGTTVAVTVKPRVGGTVVTLNTVLTNCDTAGNCIAAVTPTLASGAYVLEARATFQTP